MKLRETAWDRCRYFRSGSQSPFFVALWPIAKHDVARGDEVGERQEVKGKPLHDYAWVRSSSAAALHLQNCSLQSATRLRLFQQHRSSGVRIVILPARGHRNTSQRRKYGKLRMRSLAFQSVSTRSRNNAPRPPLPYRYPPKRPIRKCRERRSSTQLKTRRLSLPQTTTFCWWFSAAQKNSRTGPQT